MAARCPAILAPVFKDTFGDAAIYCEAEEVWGVIEGRWINESEYLRQAEKGKAFVEQNCRLDLLGGRLDHLEIA